ncbi:MAG: amine dehydrogenase [Gammaproteobacteria bacterium]|nr:amine dehydrogenase [Gammaproteobacteria bacterium]
MIRASNILRVGFALAVWCGAALAADPLPPEKIGVATAPVPTPHRLYLTDLQIAHITDGVVHIVDGQSFKYLGMFSTGLFGITALTSDSSEMLVASTYYTKRNRGDRFDQLEAFDTKTFALKKEIQIPAKHAMALPYKGTIAPSVDDAWVFIQNATPLSSVTVVDHKAWKVTAEIPTLGCWIVLPSQSNPRRFATLCGDGTLVTVTLNEKGDSATQARSEKLFDAEKDPLFVQGERVGDSYYFVSYEGNVKVINVGGDVAKVEDAWSLVDDADKKAGWKPGGYQLQAVHAATKRLYVGMHDAAKNGSHKNPAKEIWVFDLATKKRIQRAPGSNSIAMALTKEAKPTLYAYDGINLNFVRYETAPELKPVASGDKVGDFAGLIETH